MSTKTINIPMRYLDYRRFDETQWQSLYQSSIDDNEHFWAEQAQRIDWFTTPTKIKNVSFSPENVSIRWFEDGELNASVNCLDRHLPKHADKPALIWEPDTPGQAKIITYQQLYDMTGRLANALKTLGVSRGDVVTIYMPMIPEAIAAMLACARIGAIHSVVFAGFSPEALAGRLDDGRSRTIITADFSRRGGQNIPLKANVDQAIGLCQETRIAHCIVVRQTEMDIPWTEGRDHDYAQLTARCDVDCPPEIMNAEDPLFILYTSGSTGKPKGVLHTTGGYLVYASLTHEYVFNYQPNDVYWCTADIGWITGHSYIVYGPLANAATNIIFEGVPSYPTVRRMAEVVEKHKVNILYTAPTAIRALMAHGEAAVEGCDLTSLKLLGTVGEPINPEAWHWYFEKFGQSRCPIVDTWWQTETGGVMMTPMPGIHAMKPGAAMRPFLGIQPAIVDDNGHVLEGVAEGNLVICDSWPGQARTVFGNHQRFVDTYFQRFPGRYFTGDGARRDEDGDLWITGRVDDVLNVSGHRLGTAEIESAFVAHPLVAEAAVVGVPHPIKGQAIFAYVTLKAGGSPHENLHDELREWIKKEIGAIAKPDTICIAPGLPKTRSGKIMRRILRKLAVGQKDELGDISTLANPEVVSQLIETLDGQNSA